MTLRFFLFLICLIVSNEVVVAQNALSKEGLRYGKWNIDASDSLYRINGRYEIITVSPDDSLVMMGDSLSTTIQPPTISFNDTLNRLRFISGRTEDSISVFDGSWTKCELSGKCETFVFYKGRCCWYIERDSSSVIQKYYFMDVPGMSKLYKFGKNEDTTVFSISKDKFLYFDRRLLNKEWSPVVFSDGVKVYHFARFDHEFDLNRLKTGDYQVYYFGYPFNPEIFMRMKIVE